MDGGRLAILHVPAEMIGDFLFSDPGDGKVKAFTATLFYRTNVIPWKDVMVVSVEADHETNSVVFKLASMSFAVRRPGEQLEQCDYRLEERRIRSDSINESDTT